MPVSDYSSAIWGFKNYEKCETVQLRAIRSFLGVSKYTPIPSLHGDMGWDTPLTRHHIAMVRYFLRLRNLPEDRLTKRIFAWDCEQADAGHASWAKDVKGILKDCDLNWLWNRPNIVSKRQTKNILKIVRSKS